MAYCRWSSNDFQCDIYVYADCTGGYTTHIAANRRIFKEPLPAEIPFTKENADAWLERHRRVMVMVSEASFEEIKLPLAGTHHYNLNVEDCANFLRKLKDLGYQFDADEVIAAIIEDGENEGDGEF